MTVVSVEQDEFKAVERAARLQGRPHEYQA